MNFGCVNGEAVGEFIHNCSLGILNDSWASFFIIELIALGILILFDEIVGRKGEFKGLLFGEFLGMNTLALACISMGLQAAKLVAIYFSIEWAIGLATIGAFVWYKYSAFRRFCKRGGKHVKSKKN